MNNLKNEKSPYLLQHANNPVNWFPWSREAFEKAGLEDKPVFLSIGYSTCHWCHVMAHESFEDNEVAEILNNNYISVKVDREERPDIDAVYMSVCQGITGSGGWPLTIIMTPGQKPFFAATYISKNSRYGNAGLIDILRSVNEQWKNNRDKLNSAGENITEFLKKQEKTSVEKSEPSKELLSSAFNIFTESFDLRFGGFGEAPKFPTPHNLLFLLRYAVHEKNEKAMRMAEITLEQMYRGGIFDHIGGGFSRYSTDEKWLVPHFEKMLYDNALLSYVYIEAYQITKKRMYRTVAQKTLDYVLRELTDSTGGFYCGQDADSEGVEGKYYVFSREEILKVLGKTDGIMFCEWFNITENGNFEGKNIPNLIKNKEYEKENGVINELCEKIYQYRLNRTLLHKDDKILTSWNSLMIAAFAKAGMVFNESRYLNAAKNAQNFIEKNLTDAAGGLMVRFRDGESANDGQLDDYAFYSFALLELYQNTFCIKYLKESIRISEMMLSQFSGGESGGFYLYSLNSEQLISRPKEFYDGAMPSGNSAAAVMLVKLSKLTGEEKWRKESEKLLYYISGIIKNYPAAYTFSLLALMEELYPSKELICTSPDEKYITEINELLREKLILNLNMIYKTKENTEELIKAIPYISEYPVPADGVKYYLCQNGACTAPVKAIDELTIQL